MNLFLRALDFLGVGVWLGSDIFLSFIVAPGAFSILASRDDAGAVVGYSLARMHALGIVAGFVVLFARLLRTRTFASWIAPAGICVLFMIALTAVSQSVVSPRMAALRTRMGSIEHTGGGSPLLAQFTRLHAASVSLESGVLLAGFAAMFFLVRELAAR